MGALKQLLLPRLGETMEEGTIVAWLKQPGERFSRGEILFEVETDKTVVEVPALEDGVLVEQLHGLQDKVDVGRPVAMVETEGPAVAEAVAPDVRDDVSIPVAAPEPPLAAAPGGARALVTPLARRLARNRNLSLERISGTGRRGRIVRADIERALGGTERCDRRIEEQAGPVATRHGDLFVKRWLPSGPARPVTFVLLHGLFGDLETWTVIARALCRAGFPVVAPDLPCHGRSAGEAVGIEAIVDALEEAIVTTARGPLSLLGHSFGALAAVRLAKRKSLDPEALSLLAPIGLGPDIAQDFLDGMTRAESIEQLGVQLGKLWPGGAALQSPFIMETLLGRIGERRSGLAELIAQLARDGSQQVDLRGDLEGLAVPIRIVHGRDDLIVPWRHALNAPATTALHLIPECGHMPHWSAPETLEQILIAG